MLVNKNIVGLYNGVSQQPSEIRLDSQCEEQVNMTCSLVDGLKVRPPTQHVSQFEETTIEEDSFNHFIIRDETERYLLTISPTGEYLDVYKLSTGEKMTILYPDDTEEGGSPCKNYLFSATKPKEDLKAITVADYTFIVNKKETCAMEDYTSAAINPEAIAYVKNGVANTTYEVWIDGVKEATYTLGAYSTSTLEVATNLTSQLSSNLDESFVVTQYGSSVHIFKNGSEENGYDFTFSVHDSWGDQALVGIKNRVQRFNDLPAICKDGIIVEVSGDDTNNFDSYYVVYRKETETTGVWKETIKPGITYDINKETMPISISRTGTDEFTVALIQWDGRETGDEVSSPTPSFIGNTINDIFFYKNRLGFLAGENVILSKASDFYNFFVTTALDSLDDDPIDVSGASNVVSNLYHAVTYNKDLLLLGGLQQYVLHSSSGNLTPSTVAMNPTTKYLINKKCTPVGVGANVYFAVPVDKYNSIMEYFVQADNLVDDAADITSHCPRYLSSTITKLDACVPLNMIFALDPENKTIYVYNYYWRGNNKEQSAWHKWVFSTDIYAMGVVDTDLYLVVSKDGEYHLEKINLLNLTYSEFDYNIYLDRLAVLEDGVYDDEEDYTVFTLPYTDTGTDFYGVDSSTGALITGFDKLSSTEVSVPGEVESSIIVGSLYDAYYKFSEVAYKVDEGKPNLGGSLQLKSADVFYKNTGGFTVSVLPSGIRNVGVTGRSEVSQTFHSNIMGITALGGSREITASDLLTGKKMFPLMCSAKGSTITIKNTMHLPMNIYAVNFNGVYSTKTRMM